MRQITTALSILLFIAAIAGAATFSPEASFQQNLSRPTPEMKLAAAPGANKAEMKWQGMSQCLSLVPLAMTWDVMDSNSSTVAAVDQPEENLLAGYEPGLQGTNDPLSAPTSAAPDFVTVISLVLPRTGFATEIASTRIVGGGANQVAATDPKYPAASALVLALLQRS